MIVNIKTEYSENKNSGLRKAKAWPLKIQAIENNNWLKFHLFFLISSLNESGAGVPVVKKRRKFRRKKNNTGWDTPKKKKKSTNITPNPVLKQQKIDVLFQKMQAKKVCNDCT